MRTLTGAQATYQATTGAGNFAVDLPALFSVGLIDSVLGAAPANKSGYLFIVTGVAASGTNPSTYTSTASPLVATGITATGTRNFFSNEAGVITYGTGGPSTTPMTSASASQAIGQ